MMSPRSTASASMIAIDEIFGNIARYAYGLEGGEATVRV